MEDFRFWVNAAERAHRLPEKETAKMFDTGLKPDIFREKKLFPGLPYSVVGKLKGILNIMFTTSVFKVNCSQYIGST